MNKKIIVIVLMSALLVFSLGGTALAANQITPTDPDVMATDIEGIIGTVINVIRTITFGLAVLFLIQAGYLFFFSAGNPQKKAESKDKLLWFFVMLILVFGSERVLGWFFGIFELEVAAVILPKLNIMG